MAEDSGTAAPAGKFRFKVWKEPTWMADGRSFGFTVRARGVEVLLGKMLFRCVWGRQ